MKNKPMTVTFYVGGKQVDRLSEEQIARMMEQLSVAMSLYYTAHPDEYAKLNF